MLLYLVTLYPGDIVRGKYSAHDQCKAKQHGGLDSFTSRAASMTQFHLQLFKHLWIQLLGMMSLWTKQEMIHKVFISYEIDSNLTS